VVTERGVECLKCRHVGFLRPKALSRAGLSPSAPYRHSSNTFGVDAAAARVCLLLTRLRHNGRREGRGFREWPPTEAASLLASDQDHAAD
jgi:hypothetical protein